MEEPTEAVIRRDIIALLKDADLTKLSSKKVRLQLSEKYGCDLQHRKNEIDGILMDEISNQQSNSPVKEEHTTQKPTSASSKFKTESKQPTVTQSKKTNSSAKASNGNTSNDEDSDFDLPDDVKADSDSDDQVMNDEDLARKLQEEENRRTRHSTHSKSKNSTKKEKVKKSKGSGPKRPNKYMEPCNLSPALAAVVGQDQLPRHEVVKRMWAIIKERNLLDPKNKQFMLCDDQMLTVFGRKRVKTFGMMKYLSEHIKSPSAGNH